MRLLPQDLTDAEPAGKRRLFELLAVVIVVGYAWFILSFWAPAHPGVDQNGYLVGGKQMALSGSTGFKPDNPFQYVGWMWVRTPDAWYYPKYPIGLPLLNAIPLWIDWERGKTWAMYISPICTALSLAGIFLMARLVAGSFLGIMAMILLGMNLVTLTMANNPWSHGPALCFATWGMYMLLRWWQSGSIWGGIVAGFLLGYAATIRYSEGLLVLPLAIAAVLSVRWGQRPTYLRAAVPVVAWSVPVLWLVGFNWFAMGSMTGYDTTNESEGFSWKNFCEKWETTLQQLYDYGMFFIMPLGLLGLAMMWRWSWRVALLMVAWLVPSVVLYTAYYWGQQRFGMGYLRFFLTVLPAVIVPGVWVVRHGGWWGGQGGGERPRGSIAAPIGLGLLVGIASWIGLRNALPALVREHAGNWNLTYTMDQITARIPPGSVVFADQRAGFYGTLNFLQWRGDYELYAADAFNARGLGWRGTADPDQPTPLQVARRKYVMEDVYKNKTDADLVRVQNQIMLDALRSSNPRRVFVVLPANWMGLFRSKFLGTEMFHVEQLTFWKEPVPVVSESPPTPMMPQFLNIARGRAPQTWQILEVKLKTPSTQPVPAGGEVAASIVADE